MTELQGDGKSPGLPTLQRLCAEMIALRERSDRQHKLFEQALGQSRDDLMGRFSQFAADAQRAYQQLRDELTGEKRQSLALMNSLVELTLDLDRVTGSRPRVDQPASEFSAWAEGVAVTARKAQALLAQFGVHRFDAAFGDVYNPALHERVGNCSVEGLGPMRVGRPMAPGLASPAPDFVLVRAKVLVSE